MVSHVLLTRIRLVAAGRGSSPPRARVARERRRLLAATIGPTVAAAVLGNVLVGRDSLRWFRELREPRLAVPFPAFVVVGGVYYLLLGVVRYRALQRQDAIAGRLGVVVLALNELWNVAFFGRRSTRNGFFGALVFGVPLVALQKAVANDRVATLALAPYTAWVLIYDVPWSYRLWRLNPSWDPDDAADHSPHRPSHADTSIYAPVTGAPHRVRSYDGTELAVVVAGDGPPLLLAHGSLMSSSSWALMWRPLVDAGHRLIAYDLRGHGLSTLGTDGFGTGPYGRDLAAVLGHFDVRDGVVVAHSAGAIGTLALAAHAPDVLAAHVRGLVLASASPRGIGDSLLYRLLAPVLFSSPNGAA